MRLKNAAQTTDFPSLRQRHLVGEIMDQPELEADRHLEALRGLGRINWISGSTRILWRPIAKLASQSRTKLRVLDIATGGGDLPISLWRRAVDAKLPIRFEACDLSERALDFARLQAKRQGADVRFFVLDALADEIPAGYDVVICSLFLHHLDDQQAQRLIDRMAEATGLMILVNDLLRCRRGLLLAQLATRVLSNSDVVHTDGPLSVRASFTIEEVRDMARRAQLDGFTIQRRWPLRYLLTWKRQ